MNSAYHLRLVHVHFFRHKSHHDSWWQTPAKIHIRACFYHLYIAQQLAMLASIVWNIQSPLFHLRGEVHGPQKIIELYPVSGHHYIIQLFSNPLGIDEFFDVKHPWLENWQFLPRIAWARPHAQRIGLHAIGSTANKQRNDTVDVFTLHFKLGAWDIH